MCANLCMPPLAICGDQCADLQTDENNCGACATRCPATVSNGTTECVAGACDITCSRAFGDCDRTLSNGCETNLRTALTHCGACGNACSFPNAAASCVNGACVLGACAAGFADCDGNPSNGCEVNLRTDRLHCGACNAACNLANAASSCVAGACALGACATGFGNCDGMGATGCEVELGVSSLHCGACARPCRVGEACSAATCVSACPAGSTFCAGGCLPNARFRTDASNCGACGTRCARGQACTDGVCRAAPPVNDSPASALPLNMALASSNVAATTVGAGNSLPIPCVLGTVGLGADVFYSFTLTRREFVYADSFADRGTFDTVLFFAQAGAGGAATPVPSAFAGDRVCNDDSNRICAGTDLGSSVFTALNPGTYYLVLSGYGSATGTVTVHFEHLPVGSGTLQALAQGMSTLTGTTSGTSALSSLTCGGSGPENSYFWVTCPGTGNGTLTAETCGTAAFDTVLHVRTAAGENNCNDDGATCAPQSSLSATLTATPRAHMLYVDGLVPASLGAYTLRVNRP
jgi:hypothetical protein